MAKQKVESFLLYSIGHQEIGVADGQTIDAPMAPELRAFLNGALEHGCPWMTDVLPSSRHHYNAGQAKELAELLREVAEMICPTVKEGG